MQVQVRSFPITELPLKVVGVISWRPAPPMPAA